MLPGARILGDLLGRREAEILQRERHAPFDPGLVSEPVLKQLFAFWSSKRDARGALPARADIRPTEIKSLLPHIAIADVEGGGLNFRCRLFGTGLAEEAGVDLTGKSWNSDPRFDRMIERSRRLVEKAEPYFVRNEAAGWSPRSYKTYSALGLPLARDGRTVDMVLYGIVFAPLARVGA